MEDDVEDIIEQSKQQDRATTETAAQSVEQTLGIDEAAAEAFKQIDDGDLAINITVRDERLAALFEALEETDSITEIEQDANDAIDRDEDAEGNKASLARALLRVGFAEVAPEAIEKASEGYGTYLDKQKAEQTSNF